MYSYAGTSSALLKVDTVNDHTELGYQAEYHPDAPYDESQRTCACKNMDNMGRM